MNRVRLLLALVASTLLIFTSSQVQAFWSPSTGSLGGDVRVAVNGAGSGIDSHLSAVTIHTGTRTWYPTRDCINFDEQGCDQTTLETASLQAMVTARVIYPICNSKSLVACIEGVTISTPSTSAQATAFSHYSNPEFELQPIPNMGLPSGSSIPVFKHTFLDGSSPSGYYAVRVVAEYRLYKDKFEFEKFSAVVAPIAIEPGSFCKPGWSSTAEGQIGPGWPSTYRLRNCTNQGVLYQNGSSIAKIENFEEETRVKLKLRIPKSTGKWFFGQFGDVRASQIEMSSSSDLVTVDALAAKVSQFEVRIPGADIKPGFYLGQIDLHKELQNYPGGRQFRLDANDERVFEILKQLRSRANDSSVAENVVWNFRSGNAWGGAYCGELVDGVTGIIATNAMAYSGYRPAFNNGYFDFSVSGMHYNSDGSVARGSYDLLLSSEFARCLYGFTKAPISGTVTVTTENGEPAVATATVSESDGFVRLAARNFEFSEKQIRAKLVQKQTTITCQRFVNKKLKETRVIKGTVCPKGFIKKK